MLILNNNCICTCKHIILFILKSTHTHELIYEHVIIFELACLVVKLKLRIEFDSYAK